MNGPRERACVRLYYQRETAASLDVGIGLADSSNEAKQTQETSVLAGNPRPGRWKHLMSRIPLTRSLIRRPPQRSKGTRALRLRGHAGIQIVKRTRRWSISSSSRGLPKSLYAISLGLWPEKTEWGIQKPVMGSHDEIHWNWVSNFPTLRIPRAMKAWTNLDTDQALQHLWDLSDRSSLYEDGLKLQDRDADKIWLNVMLWCLRYQKQKALNLLRVTMERRNYRPPRYAVADSLLFLSRHFLFEVAKPDPEAFDAIWLLTRKFIEGASEQERVVTVSQHLIFIVLKPMDNSRALLFFWLLSVNKVVLHAQTMLQFLNRFVEMGRIDMSMRLLRTVAKTSYDLSLPAVQMACIKLLRTRFDKKEEYTIRSDMLAQMLEMGIRPKIEMFNAILANASEGGDFANARKTFAVANENGLVPDSITYNVLLKAAVLSRNHDNINMVIREIQANPEVLQNLRVLSDVLKAISLTVSSADEFGAMLDMYKQHCDLRPLQDLSLVGIETQVLPSANYHRLQPTNSILTQMILAYIRRCLRQSQGPFDLIHNYTLYYRHVKENHPLIAALAQGTAVPNAFILAFGKRTKTLEQCITVVRHMLELSSQCHAASNTVAYAAPNEHTWSILVAAYIFRGQPRAAEKVLDMMRGRGIKYTQVTWNTLISGYARMQDVDKVVKAVKGMEAAGFEADAYTAEALGYVKSQDKLMEALRAEPEKPPSDETITEGRLPPLDPEAENEARQILEWESKSLVRGKQISEYSDAKHEKMLGMELDNQSECLGAVA